jgi:hypothetical protein
VDNPATYWDFLMAGGDGDRHRHDHARPTGYRTPSTCEPEPDHRHGLLILADGGTPRLPPAVVRGGHGGAGGRREPDAHAELHHCRVPGGFLSPASRSQAFDAEANGYVRGEGAGIVVLKALTVALRDGDNICAVIKGTAVTQDGHTKGVTVPNGEAAEAHRAIIRSERSS